MDIININLLNNMVMLFIHYRKQKKIQQTHVIKLTLLSWTIIIESLPEKTVISA